MPKKKSKSGKRLNGEGSIRLRNDDRWEFRYTIKNPVTGMSERKTLVKNKDQEEEFLNEVAAIRNKIRNGRPTDPENISLWDWIYKFLHSYKKENVEKTTFDSYEIEAETHVKNSFIAKIGLKDLTTDDLQNYYNALIEESKKPTVLKCDKCGYEIDDHQKIIELKQKEARYRHCPKCFLGKLIIKRHISIRTIHYIRTQIIGSALEKARTSTPPKIDSNPNEGTEIPTLTYKKTKPFSKEEAKHFLKVISKDKHYAAIYTDAKTGIRIGELLSLKWTNTNLDDINNGFIKIVESQKRIKNRNRKNEKEKKWLLVDGKAKTEASVALIPLSPKTVKILNKHKKEQDLSKRIMGTRYKDNDYVFCNDDGTRIRADNFRKHYKVLLKKAGIPENKFHALRHTLGALLLEDGEELKVIQTLLRHKHIDTTADIYVEVTDKLKKLAISRTDDIFDVSGDDESGAEVN